MRRKYMHRGSSDDAGTDMIQVVLVEGLLPTMIECTGHPLPLQ